MAENGYEGPLTLAAGANHIGTLLRAAGYTGPFSFSRAHVDNETGADVFVARRSDVSAANGKRIRNLEGHNFQGSSPRGREDFNLMHAYSAAGGTIHFSCSR